MSPTREVIIRYKLAARSYRRLGYGFRPDTYRVSYAALETARAAMLAVLGYENVYSYMGEFCNLHERDFPAGIHPIRTADGKYQYSGWQTPIALEKHREALTAQRQRALYLFRMFCLLPVERFLAGWHVQYRGKESDSYFTAMRRINAETGVGYVLTIQHTGMFAQHVHSRRIMDDSELREFFYDLDSPVFQDVYGIERDDPNGKAVIMPEILSLKS